jgi:hypothetical protein
MGEGRTILIFALFFISVALFAIIPAYMASKRGRSFVGWLLIDIITTAIFVAFMLSFFNMNDGWFFLLFYIPTLIFIFVISGLGDTEKRRKEKMEENLEYYKKLLDVKPKEKESQEFDISKYKGKTIHEMYRDRK